MSETTRQNSLIKLIALLLMGGFMIVLAPVVLFAGAGNPPCQIQTIGPSPTGHGAWIATAYGPPWNAENGSGVTATGVDLTAGPPAYEIAVDPTVIPLESFAHVIPNPFGTQHAFYAGDTGGAIIGRHIDIYDWEGRAAQDAWGVRHVTVTPAPNPGTGNLLGEITPTAGAQPASSPASTAACQAVADGPLPLTPGPTAKVLPSGLAAAPGNAPTAVKDAIAAGNQLTAKPYLYGGGHGQPLDALASGLRLLRRHQLHPARHRSVRQLGRGLHRARNLRTARTGPLDQRLRQLSARIHRHRRRRHGHRLVRARPADRTPDGPRWQPESIIGPQYTGDITAGNGRFVQRHPPGL